MPDHVLGDRGLRHRDSNLQQFSVNAGSSPARVGEAHFPDQIPNFWRYTRSSFRMATLPIPIQSKPLAMPCDDSLRVDKEQCRAPIVPQSRKPDPQDTVSPTETQPTPTARTLQDQKLMPECKNLCLQNSASSETISQREEYGQHGLEGYRSRLCKCNNFNGNGLFGRDRYQLTPAGRASRIFVNKSSRWGGSYAPVQFPLPSLQERILKNPDTFGA
jgi:hypothetical protein